MAAFSLDSLADVIAERGGATAAVSYTRSLLDAGAGRCAKKFGEEAVEFVIAAVEGDKSALVSEAADVLYHMLVVLHLRGAPLSDVLGELERRTAQSGHQEKASRQGAAR